MFVSSGGISDSDCVWKCCGTVLASSDAHEQLDFLISGYGSTIVRCSIVIYTQTTTGFLSENKLCAVTKE